MNDSEERCDQNPRFLSETDAVWQNIDPVLAEDIEEELRFRNKFFRYAFKALDFNGIDGDYVEFGCFGGTTLCMAHEQIRRLKIERHMWACDSFCGLPPSSNPLDRHPAWLPGSMAYGADAFHRACATAGIARERYTAVEGYFDQTLPALPPGAPPNNIALAYIDCDMYSSTKTVLEFLLPRLKHVMPIAFDDYFCWSASGRAGERQAQFDVLEGRRQWKLPRYRDFGWPGTSFLMESADQA